MFDREFSDPPTSVSTERQQNKTPKTFKKILISVGAISLVIVLCLIFLNINKPLRHKKISDEYKEPIFVDLVVVIYTAASHNYKRRIIRDTWLNQNDLASGNLSVRYFFVVGNRDITNKRALLEKESGFEDIITVPVFDEVGQSSWKLMEIFKWLHQQELEGFQFKYMLRCDDATYVNIAGLMMALKELETKFLSGYSKENMENIHENFISANIQSNNIQTIDTQLQLFWGYFEGFTKPTLDFDWILCDYFLPYARGNSYVLSNRLVSYLARNKNMFRYYNREDVSLGAWLGAVNNIIRVHDRRFNADPGCQNYLFVRHNLTIFSMRDIHEQLRLTGSICDRTNQIKTEYTYNWTVTPSKCCIRTV